MAGILQENVKVINIGIRQFMDSLIEQKVPVIHVDWSPPAEEDEEIECILEALL